MGEKAVKQFNTRFKKGIEVRFAEDSLCPSEQEYRSWCLHKAITDIFSELLGRTPSEEELSGHVDIAALKGRLVWRKTLR